MSADAKPARKSQSITTPRVLQARRELIDALVEAAKQSNLTRDRAQGKLSSLMSDIWNEADAQMAIIRRRAR